MQARSSSGSSGRGKRKSGARSQSARSQSARSASGRAGGAARPMDAIRLLKQDHREVEQLIEEFEKARSPRKAQIAGQICRMLTVHATIEEEIFYPAAREALKDEDLAEEAEVEHQSAKDLIARIQGSTPDDDKFEARVKVLGEYVKHHVREEEKEMFPQLQQRKIDLEALGEQLQQRRQQLMAMAVGRDMMDDETATAGARSRAHGSRATRDESTTMNAESGSGSRRH
jgi:hemerythrin superfamily protein